MPLKDKNQLLLAYKKLAGKMHTNPEFGVGNETISTSMQLNSQQIFAQSITQDPANSPVQMVTFDVFSMPSGLYASSDEITSEIHSENRNHAFYLSLKEDAYIFVTGDAVKDNAKLQIISDNYGSIYYPKLFFVDANNNRQQIDKNSEINWVLDYSSGVIFVQDNTNNNFPSDSISWEVEAYIYTGQYLDEAVVAASQTGGVVGTTSDDLLIVDIDAPGDTDIIDGKVSIVFEDSPGSAPPPDLKAAIAYQEGQLEFYTQNLNINNIVMTLSGSELSASSIKAFGPQSSVQYHNLLGKISGSEYFVWDEENLFLTASNLFTNTITSSVITSSNIVGYGVEGSVQFKNSENYISGSEYFIWNNTTNTLTASNISASNIEAQTSTISSLTSDTITVSNTITTTTLNANNISVTNITIDGEGSSVPAAGSDTQIQYNNEGKLGASEKLTFEQNADTYTYSLKVFDSTNNNSAKLFVNTNTSNSVNTSGLLLSNNVSNALKDFKIDRQYDGTTAIYKLDSQLPLYINSDIQNLLTAGTSKLDMSIGKVEIWPTSSKYLKVNTDNITTNISNFSFESLNADILVYTQTNLLGQAHTSQISTRFDEFGILLKGGDELTTGPIPINRYYASIRFGLDLNTNYYSTIASNTRNYEQIIDPESGQTTTHPTSYQSFSVKVDDQLNKILEINKDGINVLGNIETTGGINVLGHIEITGGNKLLGSPVTELLFSDIVNYYEDSTDADPLSPVSLQIFSPNFVVGTRYEIEMELNIATQNGKISAPTYHHAPQNLQFLLPSIVLELHEGGQVDTTPSSTGFIVNKYGSGTVARLWSNPYYVGLNTLDTNSRTENIVYYDELVHPITTNGTSIILVKNGGFRPEVVNKDIIEDETPEYFYRYKFRYFLNFTNVELNSPIFVIKANVSLPDMDDGTIDDAFIQENLNSSNQTPKQFVYDTAYKSGFAIKKGSFIKITPVL